MLNEKNPLLQLKLKEEKSFIENIIKNIFESVFSLFELILEDPIENFTFELLSLFVSYIQIIIFIFNETVSILI